MTPYDLHLGASVRPDGLTTFLIWAPKSRQVDLRLIAPEERLVPMKSLERGYWFASVETAPAGARYFFRHDGEHDWPDPASRSQPDGVHGSSEVIDPSSLEWASDLWRVPAIEDYVIYELHVGTFTAEGTFDAAVEQLDRLVELGVTVIELMPVAEFPGRRNWGYDGVYPFAAHSSYGGPAGLARLVDACHSRGLAVLLDVVFNHFGPEGAYQSAYGHYYTAQHQTPWGAAINFDGPDSDEVRRYFIESASYWLRDLHIDAFRLDAVHAIHDQGAYPFLRQFTTEIHRTARELRRTVHVIAESDQNDPRLIQPTTIGGFGFDAQWSDDLHHALHARLTSETTGYYVDFGATDDLRRAFEHGYVYTGQYSDYRGRSHGMEPKLVQPSNFVVCSQNHDQVGNRAVGDRLTAHLSLEQLKLAAATILLSPFVPLLFMGEEYGERAPFQYFTSHSDPGLIEAVRRGRAEEFKPFGWSGEVPNPQDESTFRRSKLRLEQRDSHQGRALEAFYRELIRLRRDVPALKSPAFERQIVHIAGENDSVIVSRRWSSHHAAMIVLNFDDADQKIRVRGQGETWQPILDSADSIWGGPDSASECKEPIRSGEHLIIRSSSVLLLSSVSQERVK